MALRRKPLVAVVHSASSKSTSAGEDLAIYLGVCLQLGGYSDVRIVGFDGDKKTPRSSNKAHGDADDVGGIPPQQRQ
ncbi:unnamed protein product, partial [Ectocarpus sp. 6 AP-2014]